MLLVHSFRYEMDVVLHESRIQFIYILHLNRKEVTFLQYSRQSHEMGRMSGWLDLTDNLFHCCVSSLQVRLQPAGFRRLPEAVWWPEGGQVAAVAGWRWQYHRASETPGGQTWWWLPGGSAAVLWRRAAEGETAAGGQTTCLIVCLSLKNNWSVETAAQQQESEEEQDLLFHT